MSRKNKSHQSFANPYLNCTITDIYSFGVFVTLDETNEKAYIRHRELSWDAMLDPKSAFTVGQKINAVVLQEKDTEKLKLKELSIRLTLSDPWNEFLLYYETENVVQANVYYVDPYEVRVDLAKFPGVSGIISAQELAPWNPLPHEFLRNGDHIEALVTHLDAQNRILRLSIRQRILQLQTAAELTNKLQSRMNKEQEALKRHSNTSELGKLAKSGSVLVLEDDHKFRLYTQNLLETLGFEVVGAESIVEATTYNAANQPRVVVSDLQIGQTTSLEFLQETRQISPDIVLILMSSPENLERYSEEIEKIRFLQLLPKPFDHDMMAKTLESGLNRLPSIYSLTQKLTIEQPVVLLQENNLGFGGNAKQLIERCLEDFLRETSAETIILFEKNAISGAITVNQVKGRPKELLYLKAQLEKSPVGDVIAEQKKILEKNVESGKERAFANLLSLLYFKSCIGVPLPTAIENKSFALFAFSQKVNSFGKFSLRDLSASAMLLSAYLEREEIQQKLIALNRLALLGQFASQFGHEIANQVGGLFHQVSKISEHSERDCQIVKETSQLILRTARNYQEMMKGAHKVHQLDFDFNFQHAIYVLQDWAKYACSEWGGQIEFPKRIPELYLSGSATHFFQICVNLILNALQQMKLYPCLGRRLDITIERKEEIFEMYFSDQGPGIHHDQEKQIFQFGFTTRPEGSGQGLHVSHNLAQQMGGELSLQSNIIGIGSTFCLQLVIVD